MKHITSMVVACASILFVCTPGYSIGFDQPVGWAGSGVRLYDPTSYDSSPPTPLAEDIHVTPPDGGQAGPSTLEYEQGFTAAVDIQDDEESFEEEYEVGYVSAQASADYYELHGSIEQQYDTSWLSQDGTVTENDSWANGEWTVGGFFRDEIYLETADGTSADVELVFNVDAWLGEMTDEIVGADGSPEDPSAFLRLFGSWYNEDGSVGGSMGFYEFTESVEGALVTLTISNLDSGTYLPFSIGAWGAAYNGYVDFGNTVTLDSVRVNQVGSYLDPNLYTLNVTSGDSRFPDNEMAPVPEPATMLLFGTGLAGLVGWRSRRGEQIEE